VADDPLQTAVVPDIEAVGSSITVIADVELMQPVAVSIKVKVAVPAVSPVINPELLMDATKGLLLTHVPPIPGLAVIVAPAHNVDDGIVTVGSVFTVTVAEVLLQPVAVCVKVNETVPADTPVINPVLSIVATAGLLLTQVPPDPGLAVMVAPIHTIVDWVLTTGNAFTVTLDVVLLQPVAVSV